MVESKPTPSAEALRRALADAATAHHEFEEEFLGGTWDEQWAGWYAAYVLGRLGDFTNPSALTRWLRDVTSSTDWTDAAAEQVLRNLAAR